MVNLHHGGTGRCWIRALGIGVIVAALAALTVVLAKTHVAAAQWLLFRETDRGRGRTPRGPRPRMHARGPPNPALHRLSRDPRDPYAPASHWSGCGADPARLRAGVRDALLGADGDPAAGSYHSGALGARPRRGVAAGSLLAIALASWLLPQSSTYADTPLLLPLLVVVRRASWTSLPGHLALAGLLLAPWLIQLGRALFGSPFYWQIIPLPLITLAALSLYGVGTPTSSYEFPRAPLGCLSSWHSVGIIRSDPGLGRMTE